jgi:putative DNA methylase
MSEQAMGQTTGPQGTGGKPVAHRKLIEVGIPLEAINKESAREKSIRHGHPSTLHLWWARRPLATARAVLFAQLVDDPSSHPELYPTEAEQDAERSRLHDLMKRLVVWENSNDETLLAQARHEIEQSCGGGGGRPGPVCGRRHHPVGGAAFGTGGSRF